MWGEVLDFSLPSVLLHPSGGGTADTLAAARLRKDVSLRALHLAFADARGKWWWRGSGLAGRRIGIKAWGSDGRYLSFPQGGEGGAVGQSDLKEKSAAQKEREGRFTGKAPGGEA